MSPARIREMLEGFALRNIGGVFIHPRPGLVTEYLSEEWFSLWELALGECKRHGIGCHIYDENSFPSGFGGGHVVGANPLAAGSRLTGHLVFPHDRSPNGSNMGLLAPTGEPGRTARLPLLSVDLEKVPADLWHGGFPMADVCRAEVTRLFLDSTHAAYAARFSGEFGKAIRYVFTDEPETGTSKKGFHMSRAFLRDFLAEHGYDLTSRLAELCGTLPVSPAVRHDYFSTLNRLFTKNFSKGVSEWCGAHGLAFTGHYLENQWPFPQGCPSTMAAQRWMHAPGIDLLGFQFARGTLRDNALWLLTVKEATSIAAQCGRTEVLCESCGGGGYGYGPAEMKPLEDFLLALGINRLVPHLAHESLAGARKHDWPQTLSDHSPWWDAFGTHALHVARANYLLSQGTGSSRTLVLHPTTTGWLHYRPDCFHWPDESPHAQLESLRESYSTFLCDLYSAGVDFDLGDECVMAELGGAEGGSSPTLSIGSRSYETVVIPAGMQNILASTVRILSEFLEAGGTVLCAGAAPSFIEGRPSDFPLAGFTSCESVGDGIITRLRQRNPPRLARADGSALPPDLLWRYSALPDGGAIVFFSNPTTSPISAEITIGPVTAFDTFTGQRSSLASNNGGVHLGLAPGGHALWHVEQRACQRLTPAADPRNGCRTRIEFLGCSPAEENLIQLDYCDYSGPKIELRDVNTIHADNTNWPAQGFDKNLWRVSIQYRRSFVEAEIPQDSAFSVRYVFHAFEGFVASTEAGGMHVAIERPWLYEVLCNGVRLSQENAIPWFDEEARLLPIGGALVAGANVIELRAQTFHVLAEIMPVFLRGNFRLVPQERGFLIDVPLPWQSGGDWRAEGYPFYPWRAVYRYGLRTDAAGLVRITLPEFQGSALGVQLDKAPTLWRFVPGELVEIPAAAGAHQLDLLLCGNLKNLLGPHFCDGLPGAWSWENCPPTQPPGGDYRLAATGLSRAPEIEIIPV